MGKKVYRLVKRAETELLQVTVGPGGKTGVRAEVAQKAGYKSRRGQVMAGSR